MCLGRPFDSFSIAAEWKNKFRVADSQAVLRNVSLLLSRGCGLIIHLTLDLRYIGGCSCGAQPFSECGCHFLLPRFHQPLLVLRRTLGRISVFLSYMYMGRYREGT